MTAFVIHESFFEVKWFSNWKSRESRESRDVTFYYNIYDISYHDALNQGLKLAMKKSAKIGPYHFYVYDGFDNIFLNIF